MAASPAPRGAQWPTAAAHKPGRATRPAHADATSDAAPRERVPGCCSAAPLGVVGAAATGTAPATGALPAAARGSEARGNAWSWQMDHGARGLFVNVAVTEGARLPRAGAASHGRTSGAGPRVRGRPAGCEWPGYAVDGDCDGDPCRICPRTRS